MSARASSVGSVVKYLPVVPETQEMWVQSLGQEDPLEESMGTHSNVLAWRIPYTEEPGRLQSMGSQRATKTFDSSCRAWAAHWRLQSVGSRAPWLH